MGQTFDVGAIVLKLRFNMYRKHKYLFTGNLGLTLVPGVTMFSASVSPLNADQQWALPLDATEASRTIITLFLAFGNGCARQMRCLHHHASENLLTGVHA